MAFAKKGLAAIINNTISMMSLYTRSSEFSEENKALGMSDFLCQHCSSKRSCMIAVLNLEGSSSMVFYLT